MSTTTSVPHEEFCRPREGEDEPRVESFTVTRTDDRGVVTSRPRITRCVECGSQILQG